MDESIINKFYAKLVACLPMDDPYFRANLKTADLLPGNLKDAVTSKSTRAEMAEHFLDKGINNNIDNFSKLLTVMKSSKRDQLITLANEIKKESNPKPATVLDEVQNKLKTEYTYLSHSNHPHCYIQLALVQDEICDIHDKRLNKLVRHTLQGHVDEIKRIKEPLKRGLEDIFHYNNLPCPRLILILGAPGIGKTTLANEICQRWTNDKDGFLAKDYDLVILIRLRTIQERTLRQVMIDDVIGSEAAYDELLTKSYGNRCLIILEGLDEISAHWQQNDAMLCQLIKTATFLSHANILVTSRPHACINLYEDIKHHTRTIEIVGFDKPQIKEYAELYFHNSNTAEKFMEQINNEPHISSLCYVPLCLNMVLECFKCNNETLHTTLTELYQSFIISRAYKNKRHTSLGTVLEDDKQCFKRLDSILSDIPDIVPKEALETMFLLSKLAYKSYFEWSKHAVNYLPILEDPKIIYTNKDLAHCNITNSENDACGLLKATNTLFATSNTAVYSFNHLSVQEYFCALYISLLPEDQQLQLLKDHITDYPHMWPFYAGITKLKSPVILQYLLQLSLRGTITYWSDYILCAKGSPGKQNFIVLNSIYEAQLLPGFCKHEVPSLYYSSTEMYIVHPYDFMSISYFMSIVPIKLLVLDGKSIGDREIEMLAKWQNLKPSLKLLSLSSTMITHKGMESIVAIIKCSTNLTHLKIADNPIGDDGIQLFSLLKLEYLIHLNIEVVGMTEVGACALGDWLECNNSLQSLAISRNNINDNGLTKILNTIPITLVRLVASHCNLTCNGAKNIAETLRTTNTLKHLIITGNPIGDDGISAISDNLHNNQVLIQLVVDSCEFHSKGAESVGRMLAVNKKLKSLSISNNPIGDDGLSTISDNLHNSQTLIQLDVSYCEFHGKGAGSVSKMLKINKKLKFLNTSNNPIGDDGISAIASSLMTNTSTALIELDIHNCEIHSEGTKSFVDVFNLERNNTLRNVVISQNQTHTWDDKMSTLVRDYNEWVRVRDYPGNDWRRMDAGEWIIKDSGSPLFSPHVRKLLKLSSNCI